jgi:hypothetical protein
MRTEIDNGMQPSTASYCRELVDVDEEMDEELDRKPRARRLNQNKSR